MFSVLFFEDINEDTDLSMISPLATIDLISGSIWLAGRSEAEYNVTLVTEKR